MGFQFLTVYYFMKRRDKNSVLNIETRITRMKLIDTDFIRANQSNQLNQCFYPSLHHFHPLTINPCGNSIVVHGFAESAGHKIPA